MVLLRSITDPQTWAPYNVDRATVKHWLVQCILASAALVAMLSIAVGLYGLLYYTFIPPQSKQFPAYLQYPQGTAAGSKVPAATARVPISSNNRAQVLSSTQTYTVSVDLVVPTSPANRRQGNFMVGLDLVGSSGDKCYSEQRPALLPYQSTVVRAIRTLFQALPLALQWTREAQDVRVVMAEAYTDARYNPAVEAYVAISNPALQVYSARVSFDIQYSGLRYWMYYWPWTSATAFVALALFWQMVLALFSWHILSTYIYGPVPMPEDQRPLISRSTLSSLSGAIDHQQPLAPAVQSPPVVEPISETPSTSSPRLSASD
ncbi:hypothetical protein H4R34_004014 [Dimargaris verticillata]|uniref:Adipose-regulatory protein-domain-containing protein n=1 Tax=Dimargaris verticillata TaxID=2761393 RepID=A0A9W8ECL9_9FUNG|nr:hypothetical protein H4R34_004014 [Dimargaris verticillata]